MQTVCFYHVTYAFQSESVAVTHIYIVFYYYATIQTPCKLLKQRKMYSILLYFHCFNLLLYFLFGTRFLGNIQYFGNHTSPYSCFFFEINNHFLQQMMYQWHENYTFRLLLPKALFFLSFFFFGTHWNEHKKTLN